MVNPCKQAGVYFDQQPLRDPLSAKLPTAILNQYQTECPSFGVCIYNLPIPRDIILQRFRYMSLITINNG